MAMLLSSGVCGRAQKDRERSRSSADPNHRSRGMSPAATDTDNQAMSLGVHDAPR